MTAERRALADVADQLTESEATEILMWLAGNRPVWLREAFRNAVSERVRKLYRDAGRPHTGVRGQPWATWPPEQDLQAGREYLIRTRTAGQRHPREWRMSYLGTCGDGTGAYAYQFNARPAAGTQTIAPESILATKELGPSGGREDPRRYVAKVIKP